jgi:hypothetical protein
MHSKLVNPPKTYNRHADLEPMGEFVRWVVRGRGCFWVWIVDRFALAADRTRTRARGNRDLNGASPNAVTARRMNDVGEARNWLDIFVKQSYPQAFARRDFGGCVRLYGRVELFEDGAVLLLARRASRQAAG